MSKTPSSVSVCSPCIPLIWTYHSSAILLNSSLFFARNGSLICTDALRAVPRFVGHEVMYPK